MFPISPAKSHERPAALRLLFRHLPTDERDLRVRNTLEMIDRGELDPECLLVSGGPNELLGAVICAPLAGAGGICWPPAVVNCPNQLEIEDKLVETGLAWLNERGTKIVQALLDSDEMWLAKPLLRKGFAHVTRLEYLKYHFGRRRHAEPELNVDLKKYDENRSAFEHVLLTSFEQSLDCPELNGMRNVEEIIAGHRMQGDPKRWWSAWRDAKPVGVIMLSELSSWEGWELSYIGVTPSGRRQRIGRQLTEWALFHVQQARGLQLNLAVDVRNTPARNLYHDIGFRIETQKEVLLYFFERSKS